MVVYAARPATGDGGPHEDGCAASDEGTLHRRPGTNKPRSTLETALICVTRFPDEKAQTKRELTLTLPQLATLVRKTTKPTKAELPWIKHARFGNQRTDKNCLRSNANTLVITGIESDYDAGQLTIEAAAAMIEQANIRALLYTSASYTPQRPRWRVLCPTSAELPPKQRDQLVARLNGILGGVLADESFVLSQSYYFGSVNRNPQHKVIVLDGDFIDACDGLDAGAIHRRGKPATGANDNDPIADHFQAYADELSDASLAKIKAALNAYPNTSDIDRHQWLRILQSVKSAYPGDDGLALVLQWSATWPGCIGEDGKPRKYSEAYTRDTWKTLNPHEIKIATLFWHADEATPGWRDEFEEEAEQPQQQQQQPKQSFPFIDIAAWQNKPVPDRDWILENCIPVGSVSGMYGDGGTGKSLLLLMLAIAIVLGHSEWFGIPLPEGGPVLLKCCEDDEDELHRRTDVIARHYGTSYDELARRGLYLSTFAAQDAMLSVFDRKANAMKTTPLFARLQEAACDIKPRLIGIDNVVDVFGGNEIIRAQVRQFMTQMHGLARAAGSTMVMTAHPSQAGLNSGSGTSGSTGWSNAFRSRLLFGRKIVNDDEPDSDVRELKVMKANYGPIGKLIDLRYSYGVFVQDNVTSGPIDSKAEALKVEEQFLTLLDDFTAQGRRVSHSPNSYNYAPKLLAGATKHAPFYSERDFDKAMERLFAKNLIRVEVYGPPSRPNEHLVRA